MSNTVIQVDTVSKFYRLGVIGTGTLTQDLSRWWAKLRGMPDPTLRVDQVWNASQSTGHKNDYIWALKDISFEVKQGEVLGIIGRNGAGKSTMLKILSRVTAPTTGECRIKGRIASLLEVGTGFHPELTGRENIFLNGAILGMTKDEIRRKFDEIVAFSEVEKYIDTPVKRYSSGMYVRLAFAVAAHLEPEILIIDEVLAVGDAAFQKRCLGKMGDVAKQGRTVLFVSHNLAAIIALCSQSLLFRDGALAERGNTESVVDRYLQEGLDKTEIPLDMRTDRKGDGRIRITSFSISNQKGNPSIQSSDSLLINIGYKSNQPYAGASFLVGIYDNLNRPIFFLDSNVAGGIQRNLSLQGIVSCTTGPINITPGPCVVNAAIMLNGEIVDHITNIAMLDIHTDDFHGTGKVSTRQTALCLLQQNWEAEDK